MKLRTFSLALLFAGTIASTAFAQDFSGSAIKATTKFLKDGYKENTIIDSDQRTATTTITNQSDKVITKTVFLLDDKNLAIAAIHYTPTGIVRYQESYTRDFEGNIAESKLSSAEGKPLGKRVFTKSARGVTVTDYDANGTVIATKDSGSSNSATPRPVRKK